MKTMKSLLSIGQLASVLGVSVSTVRRWCRKGILKETLRTIGNHRRFDGDSYRHLLGKAKTKRKVVGYARFSSHDQKSDLETQARRLKDYGCDEVITDLGSGLNCRKPGLKRLMHAILAGDVGTLVLTHEDRLLRFGTELIFFLCRRHATQIIILEAAKEMAFEAELVKDVITLMTVFSARLYGKRSWKNRAANC